MPANINDDGANSRFDRVGILLDRSPAYEDINDKKNNYIINERMDIMKDLLARMKQELQTDLQIEQTKKAMAIQIIQALLKAESDEGKDDSADARNEVRSAMQGTWDGMSQWVQSDTRTSSESHETSPLEKQFADIVEKLKKDRHTVRSSSRPKLYMKKPVQPELQLEALKKLVTESFQTLTAENQRIQSGNFIQGQIMRRGLIALQEASKEQNERLSELRDLVKEIEQRPAFQ